MQFILIAHDKAGALPLRLKTRPAHLAFLGKKIGSRLLFGGPLLDEEGNPNGTVLVIEAEDEAQARQFFDDDPYFAVGLFADLTIRRINHAFTNGKPV